jgi:SNF2 family DNA or RNA helicase
MITITEQQTSKVPGLTSVFVGFDYKKEIVDALKTFPCFNYSKRTKLWEVPIKYLSELLDKLCQIDDIQLNLCNIHIGEDEVFDLLDYKTPPFPYQLDGIQFGLNHDKWMLLDVPGLGKTLQLIYLAQELKEKRGLKHCLVLCGINTLKTNWKKEIQKHSDLSCRILGESVTKRGKVKYGGVADRLAQLQSPIEEFFVITNIETIRDDRIVKEILNGINEFDMIVLDEAHVCKNSTSNQGSNLLKLNKATYRIPATGTLILNNPLDSFVLLKWIDADRSTKTNFEDYYCVYGGLFGNDLVGFKNLDTLKCQLELFSLRRRKDLLDLPPKTVIEEYVDMNDEHRRFYDDVKDGVLDEVDKVKLNPDVVLGMVLRLRQATACPSILSSSPIPASKIDRCCELCEQLIDDGNKVVIFSTFKQTVLELYDRLRQYNPIVGTGDTPDEEISMGIDMFQNDDEHKVFIGTWQRCGTGLTLNRASYMIFLDTPWTDGAFQQACDRIHRIGSKNPVFIYNLICTDTVDEKVLEIVQDKAAISDYIVDDEITQKSLVSLQKYIEELK